MGDCTLSVTRRRFGVIEHVKPLYVNVFWPAAAGNVFWSLLVFTITGPGNTPIMEWIARLFLLLFLAVYLSCVWVGIRSLDNVGTYKRWIVEGVYIWSIAFLALCVQLRPNWIELGVFMLLLVGFTGHILSVWTTGTSLFYKNVRLAIINFGGIAIIVFGFLNNWESPKSWLVAFLFVSVLWVLVGRRENIWDHM